MGEDGLRPAKKAGMPFLFSLESLANVPEPACFVATARVVMCPMNYATLFIPLEYAIECDSVTDF